MGAADVHVPSEEVTRQDPRGRNVVCHSHPRAPSTMLFWVARDPHLPEHQDDGISLRGEAQRRIYPLL